MLGNQETITGSTEDMSPSKHLLTNINGLSPYGCDNSQADLVVSSESLLISSSLSEIGKSHEQHGDLQCQKEDPKVFILRAKYSELRKEAAKRAKAKITKIERNETI